MTELGFITSSGPVHLHSTYHFHSVSTGTQVTLQGEAQVGGVLRVLIPLLKRTAQQQVEKELHSLKIYLEQEN